jgi:S1-C subfamily serine protease
MTTTHGVKHLMIAASLCLSILPGWPQPRASAADDARSIAEIVKLVTPAVVVISARGSDPDDRVWGSGFALDASGLIATNYHVVKDARRVLVRLSDGRETYAREVVGIDESNDLAVLRVALSGLTSVPLGDSDKVQVGDRVVAFGHPLGVFEYTVSDGIISAIRKSPNLLQITAPISRGSSGGVLTDASGRAIGIPNASVAAGQNLNFAVPISHLEQLLTKIRSSMPPRQRAAELGVRALVPTRRVGSFAMYRVAYSSGRIPPGATVRVQVLKTERCGADDCYITGAFEHRPHNKYDSELNAVENNLSDPNERIRYIPSLPNYPWPLRPGSREVRSVGTRLNDGRDGRSFKVEARVVDLEDITVPAGTYTSYRVLVTVDGSLRSEKWFSPELGVEVRSILYDWSSGNVHTIEELVRTVP